jgi:hypothetical protein
MRLGDDLDVSPWMLLAVILASLLLWRALVWLAVNV